MTIVINATKARQNFFDLLLATRDKRQITKIMLNGKVVAKISPEEGNKIDLDKFIIEMRKARKKLLVNFDYKGINKARTDSKKERFPEW